VKFSDLPPSLLLNWKLTVFRLVVLCWWLSPKCQEVSCSSCIAATNVQDNNKHTVQLHNLMLRVENF